MTDRNALADLTEIKRILTDASLDYSERTGSACGYVDARLLALRGQDSIDASPRAREERAGIHLFKEARAHGWKDDGEGAYEFIVRSAYEAGMRRATPAPAAAPTLGREDIAQAYEAGALAVHQAWLAAAEIDEGPPRGDPEFSEAANDYAAALTAPDKGGPDEKPPGEALPSDADIKHAVYVACDKMTAWQYQLEYKLAEVKENGQGIYERNISTQIAILKNNIKTLRVMEKAALARSVAETKPLPTGTVPDLNAALAAGNARKPPAR